MKGSMRYLGVIRGSGSMACLGQPMGRVEYEIEGFQTRPGEIIGSGELRMAPEDLNKAFGRLSLELTTDDGRILAVRFSGKWLDPLSTAAHADIAGNLPPASQWRR